MLVSLVELADLDAILVVHLAVIAMEKVIFLKLLL
jgi:hypothetical protein